MKTLAITLGVASLVGLSACGPVNYGVPGAPTVSHPAVEGTVFTIVFENENAQDALDPQKAPYFYQISQEWSNAEAYVSDTHPSLVNYILMTSGKTNGIDNNNDPGDNKKIPGRENLADQLDEAGVKWRAYMESMGGSCKLASTDLYAPRHNPFVYYETMVDDKERCNDRVVDFEDNFTKDLATGEYKYMWITPNTCNDMHDCSAEVAGKWLEKTVNQIMESPGYKNGGAIFVLFDEGEIRFADVAANIAAVVISPRLVEKGYSTDTYFTHNSYLATIEDIFEMPRLPTTIASTPMSEFFMTEEQWAAVQKK